MTVSQQVKEFGAKVKKDGCAGYYIYEGRNFTVHFSLEECETSLLCLDKELEEAKNNN